MSDPRVTIIVLSWNAKDLLRRFLPGVVATSWPNLEIVVADNASDDGSKEWIEEAWPGVNVIRHPHNWGYCRGNNEAIRQTTGKYVVLLNNDVEVTPGWLSPLVAIAESDERIAAVQPKVLQFDRRDYFEYAGAAGGHLDRLGYPFARGRVLFNVEKDVGQYDRTADIFWATGAAMLLRRSALETVGLLDEAFEFHMEEIDLCWRFQRAGYRVLCEPSSHVFHVGGGSLPRTDARKTYYNFRNSLLMLFKNMSARDWRRIFPQRVLMDVAAFLRFVVLGEWREATAIGRAYRDAHRMKTAYDQPSETSVLPSYRRSVVFDYFARRLRTFAVLPESHFLAPDPSARGLPRE